jgi:anti-sigma factor RsiW
LDAVEKVIDALSQEQRAALEQYLQEHEVPPSSAAEAVALIPQIHKAIAVVTAVPAQKPSIVQRIQSRGQFQIPQQGGDK